MFIFFYSIYFHLLHFIVLLFVIFSFANFYSLFFLYFIFVFVVSILLCEALWAVCLYKRSYINKVELSCPRVKVLQLSTITPVTQLSRSVVKLVTSLEEDITVLFPMLHLSNCHILTHYIIITLSSVMLSL